MNDKHGGGMAEALRLTRAGRLGDATALIQGLLRGRQAPEPAAEAPHEPGRIRRFLDGLLGRGKAGPVPEQEMTAARYTGAAGSRAYRLYVPPVAGSRPLPLLVMLHGCTQNPEDFAAGTRMNQLAAAHGLLVAWPEQDKRANAQRCWNWFQPGDQVRDRGEPAILAGIVRQIVAEQRVDTTRIYVAGLSAGGAQAAIMAAAYPDLFAAVGVHSGLACGAARDLPTALAAMRNGPAGLTAAAGPHLPTILFQGDADRTVNPANADALEAQSLAGRPGLRTEVEDGRSAGGLAWRRTRHLDARGQPVLERWTVNGAGHAWSGGSTEGSFTEPRGPDASREMLRFFLSTARRAE
ncbi:MAG: PHB depolymerase family esterase [Geminicoccaceae bacterium]